MTGLSFRKTVHFRQQYKIEKLPHGCAAALFWIQIGMPGVLDVRFSTVYNSSD